jgi:hypothetical protein
MLVIEDRKPTLKEIVGMAEHASSENRDAQIPGMSQET